jgi:maltooligosyltrehalose trehalohydrolase
MLFMGEEWASRRPFHFFCDFTGDLADAVREGRKREFAHMRERDPAAKAFENIDPNAESTFVDSKLDWNASEGGAHAAFLSFVRELLTVRRRHIVPRLAGMPHRAGLYDVRDGRALRVRWDLGGGTRLTLVANLSDLPIDELGWSTPGRQLYPARDSAASLVDALAPWGVCVYLAEAEAA